MCVTCLQEYKVSYHNCKHCKFQKWLCYLHVWNILLFQFSITDNNLNVTQTIKKTLGYRDDYKSILKLHKLAEKTRHFFLF